jgi:signal peptidase II
MSSRWLASLLLLFTSVGCDQVSKRAAEQWLMGQPVQSYWGDTFRLLYTENTGALLGMGSTWPEIVRFIVLTLLSSALVVMALGWLMVRAWASKTALAWPLLVGGVVFLAGGMGNLIDRVTRQGAVVDFMNLGVGPLRTGIFNVADVQIVLGAALVMWWQRRSHATSKVESPRESY